MLNASFIEKENIWQHEQTRYWFDVDGETYAVAESGSDKQILDSDGYPVNTDDSKNIDLIDLFDLVTNKMRAE